MLGLNNNNNNNNQRFIKRTYLPKMAPKAHKKKNTRNLTSGYSVRKSFIPTRRNVRSCQFMINLSEPNALQSTSANLLPKLSLLRFYWDFSLDSGYHFWTSFQREIFHKKKTFFCANLSVSFQNEIKQCFFILTDHVYYL